MEGVLCPQSEDGARVGDSHNPFLQIIENRAKQINQQVKIDGNEPGLDLDRTLFL